MSSSTDVLSADQRYQRAKAAYENRRSIEIATSIPEKPSPKSTTPLPSNNFPLVPSGAPKMDMRGGCALHNGETMEWLCITDFCLVCAQCLLRGDHKGHICKNIRTDMPGNVGSVAYKTVAGRVASEQLVAKIDTLQAMRNESHRNCSQRQMEIRTQLNKLRYAIDRVESNLVAHIRTIDEQALQKIDDDIQYFCSLQHEIDSLGEKLRHQFESSDSNNDITKRRVDQVGLDIRLAGEKMEDLIESSSRRPIIATTASLPLFNTSAIEDSLEMLGLSMNDRCLHGQSRLSGSMMVSPSKNRSQGSNGDAISPRQSLPVHERLHRLAVRKHNEDCKKEVVFEPFSSYGKAVAPLPLTPANRDNYRVNTHKMAMIS